MKNTWSARCDLINASVYTIVLVALVFASAPMAFADVAVLREKGPFSGSTFSNPGVVGKENAQLKVAMSTATVNIHLKRGEGDQLIADCTAEFVLTNLADKSVGNQEFLAAFPVTGMNTKIVSINNFTVEVDGVQPATVLRKQIYVSRREARLDDTPIFGHLDQKFLPRTGPNNNDWAQWVIQPPEETRYIQLTDETIYPVAYVWAQKTTPGAISLVKVTYSVTLRPQFIRYSKSYMSSGMASEVIPLADIQLVNWNRQYYFFDYILRSGSTWYGPIKKENITLTIDPLLGLKPYDVHSGPRRPASFRPNERENPESTYVEASYQKNGLSWTITGEPDTDLLIAIPATAAQNAASAPGK